MSEKIYQLNVVCEPEFSVVCGLLGEGRADKTQIKEIYDAELKHLRFMVKPVALLGQCDTGLFLAVLLSLGRAGVQYVQELFTQGEHLRALVTDAMLSAWLFAMDEKVQDEIRIFCAGQGVGVAKRLEAPEDLSPEMQGFICETLDADRLAGVRVTEAHMLVPEKSMCYVLELTDDCERFAAGHDCEKCEKKDCGMRKNNMIKILVEDQGKKYDCEAGSILIDTLREIGRASCRERV